MDTDLCRTSARPADDADRLREFVTHYAEPPELRPGDFVTPRAVSFPDLAGRRFIVVEHKPDAAPAVVAGPMLPIGGRPEVRVAVVVGEVVTTFWAERHAFEPMPVEPR